MGLIRKCDRCRKWYKVNDDYAPHNVRINSPLDTDDNMGWLLCNDCIKSLLDWMKGIKNERI